MSDREDETQVEFDKEIHGKWDTVWETQIELVKESEKQVEWVTEIVVDKESEKQVEWEM